MEGGKEEGMLELGDRDAFCFVVVWLCDFFLCCLFSFVVEVAGGFGKEKK